MESLLKVLMQLYCLLYVIVRCTLPDGQEGYCEEAACFPRLESQDLLSWIDLWDATKTLLWHPASGRKLLPLGRQHLIQEFVFANMSFRSSISKCYFHISRL